MNIKRAFLTAAALMLIPGFAMAQSTMTFETTITYLPGVDEQTVGLPASVTVTRECNSGSPLDESFDDLGPLTSDDVTFVVQDADAVDWCTISISGVDSNWIPLVASANGDDLNETGSCEFGVLPGGDLGSDFALDGMNTCAFLLAPPVISYSVTKEWDFEGADEDDVNTAALVSVSCDNVIRNNNGLLELGDYSFPPTQITDGQTIVFGTAGNITYHVNPFPASPGEVSSCSADESVFDSAVESDNGCASGSTFSVASPSASCTITNSVFFEGIPTLSQYGMAIMALLMLGVGFVGFRRFV